MQLAEQIEAAKRYCQSLTAYHRLPTRQVAIGNTPVGGQQPIRVQSMTTTDTMDTAGTVAQALRMAEAGCEYIRITAPSKKEAENLANIKKQLRAAGCEVPLVADIHFTPNAAEAAARIVEKVRVNPGNYADKKRFEEIEYTDASYEAELARIRKRFTPLVHICKEEGTAMRIGTNHGSLSDRIMSRYGDTPEGMVQSALEFVRICEDEGYYELVISMKASNPQVMVQAYRLLTQRMLAGATQHVYPLHLGVTEAGDGEDGRIKSALGIGALLADGLGDTVRVSLTEPPEREMPVGRYLVNQFVGPVQAGKQAPELKQAPMLLDPYGFTRRPSRPVANFGGEQVPRVITYWPGQPPAPEQLLTIGHMYLPQLDKWQMQDTGADYLALDAPQSFMLPNGLRAVLPAAQWAKLEAKGRMNAYPWFETVDAYQVAAQRHKELNFVSLTHESVHAAKLRELAAGPAVFVVESTSAYPVQELRNTVLHLMARGLDNPIVLATAVKPRAEFEAEESTANRFALSAASQVSALLVDGLVDGLWLFGTPDTPADPGVVNRTSFGLLQASRLRTTKTEYISCPSCGRTLFDLEETTARIRSRTEHLKGIKIGIMGCIVNGPGEMADADYGYVGSGPGVITLYKGKEVVRSKVPTAEAVDALIGLIQEHGDWVEPVG